MTGESKLVKAGQLPHEGRSCCTLGDGVRATLSQHQGRRGSLSPRTGRWSQTSATVRGGQEGTEVWLLFTLTLSMGRRKPARCPVRRFSEKSLKPLPSPQKCVSRYILKVFKEKKGQPRILYPVTISLTSENKQMCLDKQKLRESNASKLRLLKCVKRKKTC